MEEATGSSEIHKLGSLGGQVQPCKQTCFVGLEPCIFKNLSVNALG